MEREVDAMPIYIDHDYYSADVLTECDEANAQYRGPVREMPSPLPGIERGKKEVRDIAGPYSEN